MKKISVFALLALLLGVRTARARDVDDDNFRRDVLLCEEAIGKLLECCPRFPAEAVHCTYLHEESDSGCDFRTTIVVEPAFREPESACILSTSCDAVRATGVCTRAATAIPYVDVSHDVDGPTPWREPQSHPPVCP